VIAVVLALVRTADDLLIQIADKARVQLHTTTITDVVSTGVHGLETITLGTGAAVGTGIGAGIAVIGHLFH
jgi:hypothetical protein